MDSREEARKDLFWHNVFFVPTSIVLICLFFSTLFILEKKGGFLVALFIWVVSALIETVLYLMRKNLVDRCNIINDFYKLSEKYGFPTDGIISRVNDISHNSRITYYCENGAGYITDKTFFHFWKKDDIYNFLEMPKENLLAIPERDLISYTVTGDKKYITKVTGGGGGGSSFGGAVVGGMLGGATGAVIGSRKATQPITTDVVTVNNQNTIVNCMIKGNNVHFVFTSGGMYNELLKMSPSKELNILSKGLNTMQKADKKDNIERLTELKKMLDNELITQSEYEEKKKEILSEM